MATAYKPSSAGPPDKDKMLQRYRELVASKSASKQQQQQEIPVGTVDDTGGHNLIIDMDAETQSQPQKKKMMEQQTQKQHLYKKGEPKHDALWARMKSKSLSRQQQEHEQADGANGIATEIELLYDTIPAAVTQEDDGSDDEFDHEYPSLPSDDSSSVQEQKLSYSLEMDDPNNILNSSGHDEWMTEEVINNGQASFWALLGDGGGDGGTEENDIIKQPQNNSNTSGIGSLFEASFISSSSKSNENGNGFEAKKKDAHPPPTPQVCFNEWNKEQVDRVGDMEDSMILQESIIQSESSGSHHHLIERRIPGENHIDNDTQTQISLPSFSLQTTTSSLDGVDVNTPPRPLNRDGTCLRGATSPKSPLTTMRRNAMHQALEESHVYIRKIDELTSALDKSQSDAIREAELRVQCVKHMEDLTLQVKQMKQQSQSNLQPQQEDLDRRSLGLNKQAEPESKSQHQNSPLSEEVLSLSVSSSLLERNRTLVKEVRFADQACVELSGKNVALLKELEVVQESLSDTRSENAALHGKILHLTRKEAKLEAQHESMQENLKKESDQTSAVQRQLLDSEKRADGLTKTQVNLQDEVKKNSESERELKESQKRTQTFRSQLEKATEERSILKIEMSLSNDKVAELSRDYHDSRDSVATLSEKLSSSLDDILKLKEEHEETIAKLNEETKEKQSIAAERDQLHAHSGYLKSQLESETRFILSQRDELLAESIRLKAQLDAESVTSSARSCSPEYSSTPPTKQVLADTLQTEVERAHIFHGKISEMELELSKSQGVIYQQSVELITVRKSLTEQTAQFDKLNAEQKQLEQQHLSDLCIRDISNDTKINKVHTENKLPIADLAEEKHVLRESEDASDQDEKVATINSQLTDALQEKAQMSNKLYECATTIRNLELKVQSMQQERDYQKFLGDSACVQVEALQRKLSDMQSAVVASNSNKNTDGTQQEAFEMTQTALVAMEEQSRSLLGQVDARACGYSTRLQSLTQMVRHLQDSLKINDSQPYRNDSTSAALDGADKAPQETMSGALSNTSSASEKDEEEKLRTVDPNALKKDSEDDDNLFLNATLTDDQHLCDSFEHLENMEEARSVNFMEQLVEGKSPVSLSGEKQSLQFSVANTIDEPLLGITYIDSMSHLQDDDISTIGSVIMDSHNMVPPPSRTFLGNDVEPIAEVPDDAEPSVEEEKDAMAAEQIQLENQKLKDFLSVHNELLKEKTTKNVEMQDSIKGQKQVIERMETKATHLSEAKDDVQALLSNVQRDYKKCQEQLQIALSDIGKLQNNNSKRVQSIETIVEESQESKAQVFALSKERKELQQNLHSTVERLESRVAILSLENEELEGRHLFLKRDYETSQKELHAKQKDFDEVEKRRDEYKCQFDGLVTSQTATSIDLEQLKSSALQSQAEMDKLKSSYLTCNDKLAQVSDQNTKNEALVKEYRTVLKSAEQQAEQSGMDTASTIEQMNASEDILNQRITILNNELSLAHESVNGKINRISVLESGIEGLNEKLLSAESSEVSTTHDRNTLVQQNLDLEQKAKEAEQGHAEEIEAIQTYTTAKESELANLLTERSKLLNDIEHLQAASHKSDAEMTKLKLSFVSCNEKLSVLSERDTSYKALIAQHQAQIEASRVREDAKEAELVNFSSQLKELNEGIEQLQAASSMYEAEIEVLNAHTDSKQAEIVKAITQRDDSINAIEQLQAAALNSQAEMDELKTSFLLCNDKLANVSELNSSNNALVVQLKAAYQAAEQQLSDMHLQLEESQKERGELKGRVVQAGNELDIAQEDLAAYTQCLEDRLAAKEATIQSLDAKLITTEGVFREKLTFVTSQEEDFAVEISEARQGYHRLEEQLRVAHAELAESKEVVRDMQNELADTRKNMLYKKERANNRMEDTELDVRSLQKKLKESSKAITRLEGKRILSEQQMQVMDEKSSHFMSKNSSLESKNMRLRDYIHKLTTKCEEWSTSYEKQARALERVQKERWRPRT